MSEVKMKTVVVSWSETVWYRTTMEVPENFVESEIEEAFWNMDLSNEKPQDPNFVRIDYIDEIETSK